MSINMKLLGFRITCEMAREIRAIITSLFYARMRTVYIVRANLVSETESSDFIFVQQRIKVKIR